MIYGSFLQEQERDWDRACKVYALAVRRSSSSHAWEGQIKWMCRERIEEL